MFAALFIKIKKRENNLCQHILQKNSHQTSKRNTTRNVLKFDCMGYHLHRLSIKRRSNLTKTIPSAQSVKKYQEAMLDYGSCQ